MSGASARPERRGGGRGWLIGMGCGALATLATPTALLAGVLLAPALAAWLLDPAPERDLARPMLFCGLAAALAPMLTLWSGGGGMAASSALAADLPTLAVAWAAQAAAWLVAELAPLLVGLAQAAAVRARVGRLRAERARLEAEWGLPAVRPN